LGLIAARIVVSLFLFCLPFVLLVGASRSPERPA